MASMISTEYGMHFSLISLSTLLTKSITMNTQTSNSNNLNVLNSDAQ